MTRADNVIEALQQTITHGGEKLFDTAPYVLRSVLEERMWRERKDQRGCPFSSFEAFVTHPLWEGLNSSIDDLLAYCRRHPDVQQLIRNEVNRVDTHQEAGAKGGRGRKASDNVTSFERGNAATYTLRRLKKERPDLAAKVVAGTLSANAAAIEAGFRRATWSAPSDPQELAVAIARRYPGWKLTREV